MSNDLSFRAGFELARRWRDPGFREAMRSAGYTTGAVVVVAHATEPVGSVLRRVADVEGGREVLVAVQDHDAWLLLCAPRPTRVLNSPTEPSRQGAGMSVREYAEILREGARRIRELAAAANTDDARRPYGNQTVPPVPKDEWGRLVDDYLGGTIGAHCAAWTPARAGGVADLLERAADNLECTPYPVDADWIERNYRDQLWLAREFLPAQQA